MVIVARTVRIVPQARAGVVERLGRYSRTLTPGLAIVVPFIDRVRDVIDLREQVVSFPPQPVITQDNLVVGIDTVIYYQVTDPKAATYEIYDYVTRIEQLVVTTLRNVIGGIALEQALTSRDEINGALRVVLDEATGQVGDPGQPRRDQGHRPAGVGEGLDGEADAGRPRQAGDDPHRRGRAAVADPHRRGREGECDPAGAKGCAQSRILEAEGQAEAIATVFAAIHEGKPDPELLAYQYLQTLPQLAQGTSNKMWIVPSELTSALGALGRDAAQPGSAAGRRPAVREHATGARGGAEAGRAGARHPGRLHRGRRQPT